MHVWEQQGPRANLRVMSALKSFGILKRLVPCSSLYQSKWEDLPWIPLYLSWLLVWLMLFTLALTVTFSEAIFTYNLYNYCWLFAIVPVFFFLLKPVGISLRVWKVKPMLKCLKLAFFLIASRGRLLWLQKEVWLYRSLWENDPTSHLIYYLSKHCKHEFMVSVASFKSSSIQHDVHLVNYGPI